MFFLANKNCSGLAAIGRTDDAVAFHRIKEAGGPAISDPEAALKNGRRSLAHFKNHFDGVVIEFIRFATATISHFHALFGGLENLFVVDGLALLLEEVHFGGHLLFTWQWPVNGDQA